MVLKKIDSLLELTQLVTNYPQFIVDQVIAHSFSVIANYLAAPTHAGLRIPHLGVVRGNYPSITSRIRKTIKALRDPERSEEDKQKLRSQFKTYWKLKQLIQKDNERRNFKKRYGQWHYK